MPTLVSARFSILKASLIGLIGLSSALSATPSLAFTLTVLHNNDGESKLLPNGDIGGAAPFVTLINSLKTNATTDAVITLSSGDNFLAGTAFNASLQDDTFYDAIALDAIGYDAIALGNHDFDFGPDVLADFISSPNFNTPVPFLSANLDFSSEPALQALVDQGRIAKSTIVDKNGEKIGVVGATTPDLRSISSPRNVGVGQDIAGAVQAEIDALEAQGVNKIILISHLQSINEELTLIPQLSGVDIVIAGGGDDLLANPDNPLLPGDIAAGSYPTTATSKDGASVPVVTTAGEYRYVGQLEVEFNDAGQVVSFNGGPLRVLAGDPNTEPNQFVQENAVEPVRASEAALAANVIAQSEVDLNGQRGAFGVTPGVRTQETNLGNLIADALLWTGTELAPSFGLDAPTVALQNGGGIRNNSIIPAGDFTELDTFNILPFANFAAIVPDIAAAQFKEILENAVSNVENTDGRFAQIAGFKFAYDLAGTAQQIDAVTGEITTPGTRVKTVILNDGTVIVEDGAVVANAPTISIATIDFLARGGDQYPYGGADFTSLGVTYQQALANYIQDGLNGRIAGSQYADDVSDRIFVGEIPDNHIPGGGGQEPPASVPEPASVLGLLAFGVLGVGSRQLHKR
ncbi:MAG: 5'-nucleotidase C-terminal domain-containing protein [Coleofasciculus sp. S288]|nr:5'-nucleotidase C-terminal domain-containing protein [Coleofasciculus sp. S288]